MYKTEENPTVWESAGYNVSTVYEMAAAAPPITIELSDDQMLWFVANMFMHDPIHDLHLATQMPRVLAVAAPVQLRGGNGKKKSPLTVKAKPRVARGQEGTGTARRRQAAARLRDTARTSARAAREHQWLEREEAKRREMMLELAQEAVGTPPASRLVLSQRAANTKFGLVTYDAGSFGQAYAPGMVFFAGVAISPYYFEERVPGTYVFDNAGKEVAGAFTLSLLSERCQRARG